MIVSSYHFLVAPLIAMGALLVIILMCRWVFSTADRDARRAAAAVQPQDYGLLVPIASVRAAADAEMLRTVLRHAGIRCTVSTSAGGAQLLVFASDASRARDLVSS